MVNLWMFEDLLQNFRAKLHHEVRMLKKDLALREGLLLGEMPSLVAQLFIFYAIKAPHDTAPQTSTFDPDVFGMARYP